jgi:hypothetical protein
MISYRGVLFPGAPACLEPFTVLQCTSSIGCGKWLGLFRGLALAWQRLAMKGGELVKR